MKEFDINTIGRKMPYQAPPAGFFEEFTLETIARAKRERRAKRIRLGGLITTFAAAAIIAIVALGEFSMQTNVKQQEVNYDNQLNEFMSDLSTEELLLLLNERECESEYLTNL